MTALWQDQFLRSGQKLGLLWASTCWHRAESISARGLLVLRLLAGSLSCRRVVRG